MKILIAYWLPHPPPLYINIGFRLGILISENYLTFLYFLDVSFRHFWISAAKKFSDVLPITPKKYNFENCGPLRTLGMSSFIFYFIRIKLILRQKLKHQKFLCANSVISYAFRLHSRKIMTWDHLQIKPDNLRQTIKNRKWNF